MYVNDIIFFNKEIKTNLSIFVPVFLTISLGSIITGATVSILINISVSFGNDDAYKNPIAAPKE